jgi:SAM-dependent methyltransferase
MENIVNSSSFLKAVNYFSKGDNTVHGFGTFLPMESPYRAYLEFKTFLKYCKLTKNSKILELGSGNGRWGFALAPYIGKYVGVEINESLVENALKIVKERTIRNIFFINDDIHNYLSQTEESFDIIYVASVSLYLTDEKLKELLILISKKLNPGGIIVERTTTSPVQHKIERHDYEALYRTDSNIQMIFLNTLNLEGESYKLYCVTRSYDFLRGKKIYSKIYKYYNKYVLFKRLFGTAFMIRIMQIISKIVEMYSPSLSIEGEYSYDHQFFFFRNQK